jgi:D-alanyl-D-alanine dipeptidase
MPTGKTVIFLITILLLICCEPETGSKKLSSRERSPSPIEKRLQLQGLINVQEIDPSILVDLKYSGTDNFMGEDVYGGLDRCYLQPEIARMLRQAHEFLKERHPRYRFIVYDGARPRSVQRKMWHLVKNTDLRKYVAHPRTGSNHNFGAAVDLSLAEIIDPEKNRYRLLDMGTPYDHFGPLAQPRYEQKYLREGVLTAEQVRNREILRRAMRNAGFRSIAIEWWHFNAFDSRTIRRRYRIIE